jgi:general stress protein 26
MAGLDLNDSLFRNYFISSHKIATMDKVRNLHDQPAVEKLKDLATGVRICMFFTHVDQTEQGDPMTVAQVDDSGRIWFVASKNASKVEYIQSDSSAVHLVFSHPGKELYLDLYGNAEISTDKNKIAELWTPLAKAWFPQGKEDPNICLISVQVGRGNYWDTQHGKMLEFIKIISAAVTGNRDGDSVSGELELSH